MKSEIAEDVVTDPMVFCTTVYIVIYILLLLQSFVASTVQFVNEGTCEFRVCSTLLLRWAAPAGIDSPTSVVRIIIGRGSPYRRSVVHQHRVFGLLSASEEIQPRSQRTASFVTWTLHHHGPRIVSGAQIEGSPLVFTNSARIDKLMSNNVF